MMDDTIFALATAQGKAGVAVVRVSGPDAFTAASRLAGALPGRGRGLRKICDSVGGLIDQALILTFPRGASFTGEETVELQLHGSPAIVAAVLTELGAQPGLRQAEPGEFTRRALQNGCLDLAQVEGLADLIDAETEAQRKQAVRVFSGALGDKVAVWRSGLLRAMALIEATLDFADEEVPVDVGPEVCTLVDEVRGAMTEELAGGAAAERIRTGFEVAIIGAPNVGKSTLLNRLAGRSAAITSDIAGTTRDVIEVQMDISGLPVTLLDTAGLREAQDEVEQIGIERGRARAGSADLRLVLLEEGETYTPGPDDILVRTKCDLGGDALGLAISAVTGEGIEDLIVAIGERLRKKSASAGLAIRARHRAALETGVGRLTSVLDGFGAGTVPDDLLAEDLRLAIRAVDSLVGRVDVEDVLGEIFASFCIGK